MRPRIEEHLAEAVRGCAAYHQIENDIAIMAVRSTSTERLTDYGLSPTRLSHDGYNRIVVESEYCQ